MFTGAIKSTFALGFLFGVVVATSSPNPRQDPLERLDRMRYLLRLQLQQLDDASNPEEEMKLMEAMLDGTAVADPLLQVPALQAVATRALAPIESYLTGLRMVKEGFRIGHLKSTQCHPKSRMAQVVSYQDGFMTRLTEEVVEAESQDDEPQLKVVVDSMPNNSQTEPGLVAPSEETQAANLPNKSRDSGPSETESTISTEFTSTASTPEVLESNAIPSSVANSTKATTDRMNAAVRAAKIKARRNASRASRDRGRAQEHSINNETNAPNSNTPAQPQNRNTTKHRTIAHKENQKHPQGNRLQPPPSKTPVSSLTVTAVGLVGLAGIAIVAKLATGKSSAAASAGLYSHPHGYGRQTSSQDWHTSSSVSFGTSLRVRRRCSQSLPL